MTYSFIKFFLFFFLNRIIKSISRQFSKDFSTFFPFPFVFNFSLMEVCTCFSMLIHYYYNMKDCLYFSLCSCITIIIHSTNIFDRDDYDIRFILSFQREIFYSFKNHLRIIFLSVLSDVLKKNLFPTIYVMLLHHKTLYIIHL